MVHYIGFGAAFDHISLTGMGGNNMTYPGRDSALFGYGYTGKGVTQIFTIGAAPVSMSVTGRRPRTGNRLTLGA